MNHNLGNGVTVKQDERGFHVYHNGAYRFTCQSMLECEQLKARAAGV